MNVEAIEPTAATPGAGGCPGGDAELEGLRGLAVCLSLAADLVGDRPSLEKLSEYAERALFEDAPVGEGTPYVARGLSLLGSWCASFARVGDGDARRRLVEGLGDERFRLFEGAGVPEAPCWATFYLDPNNQLLGGETLKVRAVYREFGLGVEARDGKPDDHLCLMLRFCAYLLSGEADASQAGDFCGAQRLRSVQKGFLSDHIVPWIARWRYLAYKHAASDYYKGVADLVFGFVTVYAGRFGIAYRSDRRAFVEEGA